MGSKYVINDIKFTLFCPLNETVKYELKLKKTNLGISKAFLSLNNYSATFTTPPTNTF